ncbi:MAG TPA: 50S ribosomal protein L34e [Candidatus Methanofastidiosa archaeon]|nr:50S ribosomal protein L34e [Candidatus Methanofastidiosa archaeon]
MVRGMYRSRSLKRKQVRVPGGNSVIHYDREKTSKHKCAECGALLGGVPRGTPHEISKMSKSAKSISRPYGGYYCHSCLKKKLKHEVRTRQE